jgi:hypothetical protein
MEALLVLLAFVTMAVLAYRWGVDSTDAIDSAEWERRRRWQTREREPR